MPTRGHWTHTNLLQSQKFRLNWGYPAALRPEQAPGRHLLRLRLPNGVISDDFTADLRCIPMAVHRKLDLAGIKLKLQHWSALGETERAKLLAWDDDAAAIEALQ